MSAHTWGGTDKVSEHACQNKGCPVRASTSLEQWRPYEGALWRDVSREAMPECTGKQHVEEAPLPPGVVSLKQERAKRDADPNTFEQDGELRVGSIAGYPGWARLHMKDSTGEVHAVLDPDALSAFLDTLTEIEAAGPNAPPDEQS